MNVHDWRTRLLVLWLKAWRALHPARHGWMPLSLWFRLQPPIRLSVHTVSTLDQRAYRFRNDDADEANATWMAAENTNVTIDQDVTKRVRFQVDDIASGVENNVSFQLQYNLAGGGWNNVTDLSSVVRMVDASGLINTEDTTAQLSVPSGGSFIAVSNGQQTEVGSDGDSQNISYVEGTHDYCETEFGFQIRSADVTQGQTLELRCVRGGGSLLDSYNSGTATITVGAAPTTPVLAQSNFRIRTDDSQTLNADAGWAAALNANATIDLEVRFRIRFEIEETAGGQLTDQYKLQYNLLGGGWNDVPTFPLDWTSGPQVPRIHAVDSKQYADSDPTTNVLAGSAQPFTAGVGEENGNLTTSITLLNQHTELEFCVLMHRYGDGPVQLDDGDTVQFRVVRDDGTVLDTYTNTPTVTVNHPPGLVGGVYVESPGVLGPFEDGNGNKYTVIEETEFSALGCMIKSTNGGDLWEIVDNAGRPTTFADLEGVQIIPDGDRLLVLWFDGATPRMHSFHMSSHGTTPDTWVIKDEAIDTAILDARTQVITGALRSDGSVIAVYAGDTNATQTNFDIWCNIRSPGGTWGTPFQIWNHANNANEAMQGVLGDNDHFYVFSNDTSGTFELWGKRINGSTDAIEDLFGTAATAGDKGTVIDTAVDDDTPNGRNNVSVPVYWNDGNPQIWVAWAELTTEDLYGRKIQVGSGGSVGARSAVINDAGNVALDLGGSRQVVCQFVRDAAGDLHVVYARESGNPIPAGVFYSKSTDDGATWATDTELVRGVDLRSPKSRLNWVRGRIQANGNFGLFYDDASSTEQNNDATGGDPTFGGAGYVGGFIWYDEYSIGGGGIIKVQAETVQSSESDLTTLALARIEGETEQLSETDIAALGLLREEGETEQLSEDDISVVGLLRVEGHTVQISEGDLNIRGLLKQENENEQVSEADLWFRDRTKVENETEQVSEVDLHLLDLVRIQDETEQLSEGIIAALDLLRVEGETEQVSEANIAALGLVRVFDETEQISEVDLNIRGIFRVQDETVQISEADLHFVVPAGADIVKVEDETVQISEGDLVVRALVRIEGEDEQISEATIPVLGLLRTQDNTVQIAEGTISVVGLLRQEDETTQIAEADLSVRGLFKIQDETVQISEADLNLRGIFRIEDETVQTTEADLKFLTLVRVLDETVQISEEDLRFVALLRIEDEVVQLAEADISVRDLLRLVTETEQISEAEIHIVTPIGSAIVKVQDETVQISEGILDYRGLAKIQDETVQVTEEDLTLKVLTRIEGETVQIPESEITVRDLIRIQTETAQMAEQVINSLGLLRLHNTTVQVAEEDIHRLGKVVIFGESVDVSEVNIGIPGAIIPTPPFVTVELVVQFKLRDAVPVSSGLRDLRVE